MQFFLSYYVLDTLEGATYSLRSTRLSQTDNLEKVLCCTPANS